MTLSILLSQSVRADIQPREPLRCDFGSPRRATSPKKPEFTPARMEMRESHARETDCDTDRVE
jgi:hypothetical protein